MLTRRWLWTTLLILAIPCGWAQTIALDGEPGDWDPGILVRDPEGDSRGPTGSDILAAAAEREEDHLLVLIRVAGRPEVRHSTLAYHVDFDFKGYVGRRVSVWGDGVDLSGRIVYSWKSRQARPQSVIADGVDARAGSAVEIRIPFALLGGAPARPVRIKASTADFRTSAEMDALAWIWDPREPPAAPSLGRIPLPPRPAPGVFAGYRGPDGTQERWAVVAGGPDEWIVEHRRVAAGAIAVSGYAVDGEGRIRHAWEGVPGGPARLLPTVAHPETAEVAGPVFTTESAEVVEVPAGRFPCTRVVVQRAPPTRGRTGARFVEWYSPDAPCAPGLAGHPELGGLVRKTDAAGVLVAELSESGTDAHADLERP